jgi:uncharacterized protein YjiS (DUF1127 family)
MTATHLRSVQSAAGDAASLTDRLTALVALVQTWWRRAQQRHELAELSDAQLRDVGLTRYTVAREAAKSFWLE